MREDTTIGLDEPALDDAALEALAEAYASPPPAALRRRVLAAARDELDARRRARALRRWRAIGAVAAVVTLVLAGVALRQSSVADVRATALAAAARTNAELSARLDDQARTLAGLREAVDAQAQVLRVLAGPRTLTAALTPKEGVSGAGRVVVDAASGEGALVLSGLDDPGRGRAYELWAIRGDRPPEPSGVFVPAGGRPLAARVAPIVRPSEVTAFAVSIEPAGGSASPTGPIVLVGAVAS